MPHLGTATVEQVTPHLQRRKATRSGAIHQPPPPVHPHEPRIRKHQISHVANTPVSNICVLTAVSVVNIRAGLLNAPTAKNPSLNP